VLFGDAPWSTCSPIPVSQLAAACQILDGPWLRMPNRGAIILDMTLIVQASGPRFANAGVLRSRAERRRIKGFGIGFGRINGRFSSGGSSLPLWRPMRRSAAAQMYFNGSYIECSYPYSRPESFSTYRHEAASQVYFACTEQPFRK